jgi:hypothetical protein
MAQWQIADKIGWLQNSCAQRDSINPMASTNANLVIEGPQPRDRRRKLKSATVYQAALREELFPYCQDQSRSFGVELVTESEG